MDILPAIVIFAASLLYCLLRGEMHGVLIVVRILCYVGLITGLWRSSGTIGIFIWYGMRLIPPRLFLLLAFLLSALLSYAIGTSFGVTSTAGVMLMALARAGGVPVPLAAGAILSGVYFGDRGAPTSSCATLQAELAKVDHYTNVRHMLKTGALPCVLTLVFYTYHSLRSPIAAVDTALLTALEAQFDLNWLLFLPAALMLVLPAAKIPLRLSMGLSAAAAFLLTVLVQRVPVLSAVGIALRGYAPEGMLAGVLSGGGFFSMVPTMLLLLFAGSCTGLIGGLELLKPLKTRLTRLSDRLGSFTVMVLTSLGACMVFCNQTIAMMFCAELTGDVYPQSDAGRQRMAAELSCSVVTIAGLVPWCIACSVPLTMLGAGYDAVPYACYLYLIPVCYFLTQRLFFPKTEKERKTEHEITP